MRGMMLVGSLLVTLSAFAAENDIRVVSYNIRYGTAKDGDNHWDKRREWLVETIREMQPDLLGTQETLGFQRDFLAEKLPEWEAFGVGREDGKDKGEQTALFFRTARFEKLAGGHFWLSETPDQPGSKSWDSSLPRMATWVKLRDKRIAGSPPLIFLNTHFDHIGERARVESAKLLRKKAAELAPEGLVIITGDFNAGEGSGPYRALFGVESERQLIDTFRVKHTERGKEEGTFSGFQSAANGGARIDWIAVSERWNVVSARIDRTAKDGRTPSDHFAVEAVLTRSAP